MATAPLRVYFAPHNFRYSFAGDKSFAYASVSFSRSSFSSSTSVISCSGRRPPSATSRKIHKKKLNEKEEDEEEMDEDAFEALFQQLEEDLKNDELEDGDFELDEDDLAKLEKELAEAMDDDELLGALEDSNNEKLKGTEEDDVGEYKDEHELEDENEEPVKLKNWQLRRLAYALKNGRRKTGIKSLAAELCLDRPIVLKLLRDPPPNLMMLSAALPDRPASIIFDNIEKPLEMETPPPPVKETPIKQQAPIHVMQSNWMERKRLKKVHVETLERVYRRTKRPTNAMISSIVHVTNLPKRKVLKWFEDKRAEEGVPDRRIPYQPSSP